MQSMFIYRVGVYAIESSRVESSQVGDFMNMNILVSQVCAYVCKCMYMYEEYISKSSMCICVQMYVHVCHARISFGAIYGR